MHSRNRQDMYKGDIVVEVGLRQLCRSHFCCCCQLESLHRLLMAYCFGLSLGVTLINVGTHDIRLQGYITMWLYRALPRPPFVS